ncbi:hypothetical protein D1AOALGA4SA_2407 [Olavius algarvensis Delta 1 endosymbiont]|nr:hypothetical protein D1AOALGA4SA_2407 [Olavius algarvensis Delta 1 endosymbiont]
MGFQHSIEIIWRLIQTAEPFALTLPHELDLIRTKKLQVNDWAGCAESCKSGPTFFGLHDLTGTILSITNLHPDRLDT